MKLEKNPTTGLIIEVFGPTIEYLTSPDEEGIDFCVLKGTIPPGVAVPLHSHPDTEDFIIISGSMEGLRYDEDGYHWIVAEEGDFLHVPGNARHAWRNNSGNPVISLMITTRKMGRFFREIGKPATGTPAPPTPEDLARFAEISARYGYWNATPEENEAAGIPMSF